MALFIGHCGRSIRYVGTTRPIDTEFEVIEVDNLNIPSRDLMDHYEIRRGTVVPKSLRDHSNLRVAFIGVYKIACGISTYAEWLWADMAKLVGEYKIFAEISPGAEQDPNVVRCWRRGYPLTDLIDEVRAYDPDVVYIQHEYGIFPVARHWISLLASLQQYRVITTLHSVYLHKDKLVCEAAIPEMVVHTNAGADILKNVKKVRGKVHMIPHGCLPCESATKYWNLYQSNHTLIQMGFGFRYKNWDVALMAVSALAPEYRDLFFTGLFSETIGNKDFHDEYYRELSNLIDRLNIRAHAGLIRGFQSEECLDSFLRTNRVAIFPYGDNGEHTVYGCSGAARLAMSKGIPVIVSAAPLFDDLEGICDRPATVENLCESIRRLFSSDEACETQVNRQNEFLRNNSWAISAQRYLDLL